MKDVKSILEDLVAERDRVRDECEAKIRALDTAIAQLRVATGQTPSRPYEGKRVVECVADYLVEVGGKAKIDIVVDALKKRGCQVPGKPRHMLRNVSIAVAKSDIINYNSTTKVCTLNNN
jgi:hypothetical protein